MMRDGRNPYGARGGYTDRDMMYDDRNSMDYADMYDSRRDYRRSGRYDRESYDSHNYYPFEMRGGFGGHDYDYRMDGRKKSKMLSDDKLKKWSKMLLSDIEDKHKQFFKMETVITKAEEMGIRFDKFTPLELYVTVLMMFTDYNQALSTINVDIYIKLAKAWLCDEDASLQYAEKLAAYYNYIVEGE